MNSKILQLDEFFLTKLSIRWHEPEEEGPAESTLGCDYDVLRHKKQKHRFRVTFRFRMRPAIKEAPVGYDIDTEIIGFFSAPKELENEKMQYLVRVNGCMILYGILRGEIANSTGSFPGGKFNMPTLDMVAVVRDVESHKAATARAEKKMPATKKSKL